MKLHFEIFTPEWLKVLEKLRKAQTKAVIGGGSAVALFLGHRKSYDVDLFLEKPVGKRLIFAIRKIFQNQHIQVIEDTSDELSFIISDTVKITYLHFPFKPLFGAVRTDYLPVFHKRDLASNKAYSIGRRGAYRDYVDLFFLVKSGLSLTTVVSDSKRKFHGVFNEKLFLQQLVFMEDIRDFTIEFTEKSYSREQIASFFKNLVRSHMDF